MCPDMIISGGGGSQDVTEVIGSAINGLRCVEYARPLNTGMRWYILIRALLRIHCNCMYI